MNLQFVGDQCYKMTEIYFHLLLNAIEEKHSFQYAGARGNGHDSEASFYCKPEPTNGGKRSRRVRGRSPSPRGEPGRGGARGALDVETRRLQTRLLLVQGPYLFLDELLPVSCCSTFRALVICRWVLVFDCFRRRAEWNVCSVLWCIFERLVEY